MACIRKRRGKYVVDYRDGAGIRRWVTCDTRGEAQGVLSEKLRESRQASRPAVNPDITVSAYLARWETLIASGIKSRTLADYKDTFRLHLTPAFGPMKIRHLHRGRIKVLLAEKLASGLSRNSVRIIHATLRAMLNAAIDDGVILANPAERLGRQLRLVKRAGERQEGIKAFTREQLAHFLATAAEEERHWAPLFFTMARTGLRLGEALALQWEDLHFRAREIRVARGISRGRLDTPKSRHGRTVDMSQQLTRALLRLQIERKTETLRRGWPALPPWVFCSKRGTPLDTTNADKAFKRVLKDAELPRHFTPHCLRHTFASLLLQQGESPAYVQRQLGHASIQLTVDTYGRWLPMGNKAAVDRLDDASPGASGSKVVANGVFGGTGASEAAELTGAGGGS